MAFAGTAKGLGLPAAKADTPFADCRTLANMTLQSSGGATSMFARNAENAWTE